MSACTGLPELVPVSDPGSTYTSFIGPVFDGELNDLVVRTKTDFVLFQAMSIKPASSEKSGQVSRDVLVPILVAT